MSAPPRVAVLSAARTPIGKYGGALRNVPAVVLGGIAAGEALRRASLAPSEVPEGIFGQCLQAGAGQNPARQLLRSVDVPDHAGAVTVNMVCGSGLQAIRLGAAMIRSGEA